MTKYSAIGINKTSLFNSMLKSLLVASYVTGILKYLGSRKKP